jgi:hypothetical protein
MMTSGRTVARKRCGSGSAATGLIARTAVSMTGSVTVHAAGWRPVVQYPVAEPGTTAPVTLDAVEHRLVALAHPVRLRLVRTLARGPHTTSELAQAWDLTPPEVSRHLAVLRRAGLLTSGAARPLRALRGGPSGADGGGDGPDGGGAALSGGTVRLLIYEKGLS